MKNVDLRLLAYFDAIMEERHVTHAAERMSVNQPTMSRALGRLRELFRDPILVRTSHGYVPTERALQLWQVIRDCTNRIDHAIQDRRDTSFDPSHAELTFRISASDYMVSLFLPGLMSRMSKLAPGVSIVISPPDALRMREDLVNGRYDLAMGFYPYAAEDMRICTLVTDHIVCIASIDNPAIARKGEITLDDFCEIPHVAYTPVPGTPSMLESVVDDLLKSQNRSRKIGVSIPSIFQIPVIVAQSNLISTTPLRVATLSIASDRLQILAPPLAFPDFAPAMLWSEATHHDPTHLWLRQIIRDVCNENGNSSLMGRAIIR